MQRLEHTHRELKRSEESLTRAEKMAALGRLSAGIAHEINTPLGASMTALKLLQGLIDEYHRSIRDPSVSPADHEAIAGEMSQLLHSTWQWIEKAAAYIRGLKAHARNVQRSDERLFSVSELVEQIRLLLSHKLRVSQCELRLTCPAPEPHLYGDAGKLSQVVTNLVLNAIDSYKDKTGTGNPIEVAIEQDPDDVLVRVIDRGSGMTSQIQERIFDEFFSTKEFGEGTGLGLSIARDIVHNVFNGRILVESSPGQGSIFTLRLPKTSPVRQPVSRLSDLAMQSG
jgi:C4-dicarboxylate-specific signal transduction histidine kinase